jgi:two-component system response regulator PilR (NtrC family)
MSNSTGTKRVLIVDDEPDIRELLTITLERMSLECESVGSVPLARASLQKRHFDLCLTDMRLPGEDGIELVKYVNVHHAEVPIAVITAHGNTETAVAALKAGAFDFVSKPIELGQLRVLVSQALRLDSKAQPTAGLIGNSPEIAQVRELIAKFARNQAPVHISGESGTGKELVARLIHENGPRKEAPFVPVNCGAIPGELLESEFFGSLRGSYTGATQNRAGLLQAAQGGTLFLDEIAELPTHMQVKLLRVIQEKKVRPLGADAEASVDFRVLSATHRNLAALVEEGTFRKDLFYRINVIELHVPALRSRREDVEVLAANFLARRASDFGVDKPFLSNEALRALRDYSFPGNVRELENILERALALTESPEITPDVLRLPVIAPADAGGGVENGGAPSDQNTEVGLRDQMEALERARIIAALERARWNKTRAAASLGLTFQALRYRLRKLGID